MAGASLIALSLILTSTSGGAHVGGVSEPLRVGISPFAPFVIEGQPPSGYSIDLWQRIAEASEWEFSYVGSVGVQDKLQMLTSGEIDVAIGGITMTRDREEAVDFALPSANAGIGILVRADDDDATLWSALVTVLEKSTSRLAFAFILLIVISGHLIWIAERGADMFSDRYVPGVFEGMYWAIVTASTVGYGDKAPVNWAGRVLAGLVIVVSLPMFALFTAELASVFTVQGLHSQIRGPQDLEARIVGVVAGTASATYAAQLGLRIVEDEDVDKLYAALESREVDAVVYDAPNLQHYARTRGKGRVTLAGPAFRNQAVGMAVPTGSPLREHVNRVILDLDASGDLAALRARWLGSD